MCDEKPVGFYINLDKRSDRKDHFEKNVKCHSFFSNIERMSAIYHHVRGAGCTLSHIECLRMIQKMRNNIEDKSTLPKYYAIIEDDFSIIDEPNFNDFVSSFDLIKNNKCWDVILLTPKGKSCHDSTDISMDAHDYIKIKDSSTTTGYILKDYMIDVLLENYTESFFNLVNEGAYEVYALDQFWKKIQLSHNFYYYINIYGGHLPGWSDIEKRFVDYNYAFIIQ